MEEKAKRLLEDPVFNHAWDTLRQRFLDTWENSHPEDMNTREQAWLSLRNLNDLKQHFTSIVMTGEFDREG
ncbi:MAG: hypothetical protein CME17_10845 [Gemmatimonadetes bacterium]|jgi:hypothetical protein|nr:hypothetical protein [Gemmatimonadota bacterium]|tara:strand:+ start:1119 stop:1331 length:213 start_codon:yes stop_codon:yes gene_type:complete